MQRAKVGFGGPGRGTSGRSAASRTLPRVARALGAVSLTALGLFLSTALGSGVELAEAAPCDPPIQNAIVCENSKPGNPQSEWDVSGGGDPNIQGFATDISVDQGQTVHFKIDTTYSAYHLDIYRMGYYGGDGARKVATVPGVAQNQDPCLDDSTTGLIDCGNWAESASWAVPADAVSGIYFAKLVRDGGTSDGSHIFFIVRDDASHSNLLFQTSDTTWEAYNQYGGRSLYTSDTGGPGTNPDRAYKVSYNRPLTVRGGIPEDSPFNAEYPMVRWLERNGYDVSYFTGVDSARFGSEILEHKTFLSVGHDEYWSGTQRANIEAARAAGVNLAFFSGNESFWKTRWEPSTASGSTIDWRTLVSYKETHANAKIDPGPPGDPNVWTGTWRDPRFSPPADGGRPENAVTGTMFRVNSGTSAIDVPAADGKMRIWRNTSIASQAPGQTATLSDGTLGYEWDEAPDNATRPAGLVPLSSTTRSGVQVLQDFGSTYGSGTATHNLTLYRAPSGALVFGAGTIQWSWGLDGNHDRGSSTPDPRMQQATVNLLADMGAQPDTLQGDLAPATASTDTDPPSSVINSPLDGANVESGQPVTISGTATDAAGESGGGQVGSVEVSTDGGTTWHPAQGRANWTYSWTPGATGSATIKTRATDDSGNLETPGAGVTVNVTTRTCPCSIWNDSFTAPEENDPGAVEVGVKFRSDEAGFITGLRFYKTSGNTGTHVGHLWAADGTQLAEAAFSGETGSGWQQVSLGSPVAIDANTTYIASYHAPAGHYAATSGYFATGGFDSAPLHALGEGVDGSNGVYKYGPSGSFPTDTFQQSNYWVDVVFENTVGPDTTPPTITARSPVDGTTNVSTGANVTTTFSEPMDPATINGTNFQLRDPSNAVVPATVTYDAAQRRAILDPSSALQNSTTYTATVKGDSGGVTDDASPANALASDSTWSFTTAAPPPPPPDEGPGGPILA
ncbi:MAG: N,N-dimethylformamidase beta subunit family domain-containing protein, partial [Solirubrobacterales bacterium]